MGSYSIQALVNVFISTVYLVDIKDAACALGAHRCNKHGYAGTKIGLHHRGGAERM